MAAMGTTAGKTAAIIPLLALALVVPLWAINAEQAPAGEEPEGAAGAGAGNQTAVQLYDSWFPQSDVPDTIKEQIVDHLLNSQPIPMPLPDGQEELGRQAADLIIEINSATDKALKEQKQRELDLMTVDLLRAGIVVAERYHEDPAMWDGLLEEFMNDGGDPRPNARPP